MMAVQGNIMDTLGSNPVINVGGVASVFTTMGLWFSDKLGIITPNDIFTVVIGFMSFTYLGMQIYLTYIRTKKEKAKKE